MSAEKFIHGKVDSCHHHGKRSEVRRLAEWHNQLGDYMSHERYGIEARLHVPFSHTIPSQERTKGIGDDGDGVKDTPVVSHTMPVEDFQPDEVDQLLRRGAVFPLNIAEPQLATGMKEYLDVVNRRKDVEKVQEQEVPTNVQG